MLFVVGFIWLFLLGLVECGDLVLAVFVYVADCGVLGLLICTCLGFWVVVDCGLWVWCVLVLGGYLLSLYV